MTGTVDEQTLDLIKTETQRENAHIGETLVLKTAAISDEALAGIADSKSVELPVESPENNSTLKDTFTLGFVFVAASGLALVFTKRLKRNAKITKI